MLKDDGDSDGLVVVPDTSRNAMTDTFCGLDCRKVLFSMWYVIGVMTLDGIHDANSSGSRLRYTVVFRDAVAGNVMFTVAMTRTGRGIGDDEGDAVGLDVIDVDGVTLGGTGVTVRERVT